MLVRNVCAYQSDQNTVMTQSIVVWLFTSVVTSNPASNKKEKLVAGRGNVHKEKLLDWYVSLEIIMAIK
jgi:hypothetical protein